MGIRYSIASSALRLLTSSVPDKSDESYWKYLRPDVNKLLVCPARIVRGATTEMSSKAMTENRYPPFLAFVRAERGPETLRNAMVTTDYYNSCCCSSTSSTRIVCTTQVVNPTTPALVCCRTSQKLMTTQIIKITPPLLLPPPPPALLLFGNAAAAFYYSLCPSM